MKLAKLELSYSHNPVYVSPDEVSSVESKDDERDRGGRSILASTVHLKNGTKYVVIGWVDKVAQAIVEAGK